MMPTLLNKHLLRGAFYALTIVLGMLVALQELDFGKFNSFATLSVALSLIFVVELYSGWVFRGKTRKRTMLSLASQAKRIEELVHHLLLPTGLYVLSIGFIYYNRQPGPRTAYLVLLFVALTILFTNIRAFYEKAQELEATTHFIYDAVKLIMYFVAADVLLYVWPDAESIMLSIISLSLFSFGLLILSVIRYRKFESRLVLLLLGMSIVNGLILLITFSLTVPNNLQMASFAVLVFYVMFALVHHRTHRTLTWTVIAEYLTVIGIAFLLLIGLA